MLRTLAAAAVALLFSAHAHPAETAPTAPAASPFPAYYDAEIQRAAARYLPFWHWTFWKAQLYAESGLNPAAVSPVGARGLAQLMPGTHDEIRRALRAGMASPHDTAYAIEAGAFYMARMRATWTSERPEAERRRLAWCGYNAGAGNCIAAQRACLASSPGPCRDWWAISAHLHRVTGRHAAETLGYVARIERLQARMAGPP
jgi:membrane-bound lytic murein transglycosylase MltF